MANRENEDTAGRERQLGLIGVLAGAHVKGLDVEEALMISARLSGGSVRQAGRLIGYSESQARRRWERVMELVLVPVGMPQHDEALVGVWIALHASCCTARAVALLETDSRFVVGSVNDFR